MTIEQDLARGLGSMLVVDGFIRYHRGSRFTYIELQLANLCTKCKKILERRGGSYKIKVDSLGKAECRAAVTHVTPVPQI
jgi:hypothetical protein